MIKKNGFTMVEVIIASSIFLSTILILIPIFNQVQMEQSVLADRRIITNMLHEELQQYIWEEANQLPAAYEKKLNHKELSFRFSKEEEFIKGCVQWNNAKQNNESFCLYGFPKQ